MAEIRIRVWAEIGRAGTQQLEGHKPIDRSSYITQIAWASAENTSGNRTLDTRFAADAGVTAEAWNAHVVALRYKEPGTTLGPEE